MFEDLLRDKNAGSKDTFQFLNREEFFFILEINKFKIKLNEAVKFKSQACSSIYSNGSFQR